MEGTFLLAKLRCTCLSECPSVTTDGMTAWVVGVPAPEADGIGEGEAAVSLPLDVLLAAVDVYRAEQEHGTHISLTRDGAQASVCGYVKERRDGGHRMRDCCAGLPGHDGEHGPWVMLP